MWLTSARPSVAKTLSHELGGMNPCIDRGRNSQGRTPGGRVAKGGACVCVCVQFPDWPITIRRFYSEYIWEYI